MRAFLLIAGFWAGLSVAHAGDEDPVSLFQRVCMGPGPFRHSLIDFVTTTGWEQVPLGASFVNIAVPPGALQAGASPFAVAVGAKEWKFEGQTFESCTVRKHRATMDQHLDRVRSTLGLVGPGEIAPSHIMRFLGRADSSEKALQWPLSSGSSDYVSFREAQLGFPTIYLQRLRSPTREKP